MSDCRHSVGQRKHTDKFVPYSTRSRRYSRSVMRDIDQNKIVQRFHYHATIRSACGNYF
jgi:hypothetical protein